MGEGKDKVGLGDDKLGAAGGAIVNEGESKDKRSAATVLAVEDIKQE